MSDLSFESWNHKICLALSNGAKREPSCFINIITYYLKLPVLRIKYFYIMMSQMRNKLNASMSTGKLKNLGFNHIASST